MEPVTVRRIPHGGEEYTRMLDLRNRVLRRPLGMDIGEEDLSGEAGDYLFCAFLGDSMAGCLVLTPLDKRTVKMRQVAVESGLRGRGVGRALVLAAENTARAEGFGRIRLHARKTAVPFYLGLDYAVTGGEFTEVGIAHLPMEKRV